MSIHGYVGNIITANPTAPTSTVASGVWTTEQQLIAVAAGNWPFTIPTQQISRSLRFNRPDSAYLNRTFSTGNRKTWTWSCWIKRSTLDVGGGDVPLISSVGASSTYDSIRFNSDSTFRIYYSGGAAYAVAISGSPVFRDVSAWYHIVVAQDTTQATEANRLRVWINGVQQTLTGIPAQNYESGFNNGVQHEIGKQYIQSEYFPGYMAEAYFIGGSALTPSSFGRTSTTTGVWEPIAYTGSYAGTNSFYLPFSDNASTTTLGDDFSGNNNDWTPNNFSVTAGAGNDSMVDSPTAYGTDTGVGGEVRGNYCTMNPLQYSSTYVNLRNGNLDVSGASGVDAGGAFATAKVNSGKWYWEALILGTQSTYPFLGFAVNTTGTNFVGGARIGTAGTPEIASPESFITLNGSPSGTSFTTNDVIQFALDMDNGKMWVGKNNTWMNSGVPASGTGNMFSISDTSQYVSPYIFSYNASSVAYNFGQRAFAYTAPSGFKALCTTNLPTPTIGATSTTLAGKYFTPYLYTADGTSPKSRTGIGFAPDFLWFKSRSTTFSHALYDQVRGTNKGLQTNTTAAENTYTLLSTFGSDGFTTTTDGTVGNILNDSTNTYVTWCWNAGGSNATNTSGTITSTVRANTTSGFSIVTYTGTGANATVGHGLGVAPSMIIIKQRDAVTDWYVYHTGLTSASYFIRLNLTNAEGINTGVWNSTAPTSSVINLGSYTETNASTKTYVAYCFAPVAGYSAFGKYTGNASTDGPFVYTGFRPEFIMTRSTSGSREWYMYDAARDTYNVATNYLRANTSAAEGSFTSYDMVSNGFKLRSSDTAFNGSGETYIYMAFAEFPFKFSLAR